MQNQPPKSLDLADIFGSALNQLQADKNQINAADNNGSHGSNIVSDFETVANTLNGLRGQDAGNQLRQAASVLQQNGQSPSAGVYAQGLLQAAQNLQGKTGITAAEVLPLVQGLVSGVQRQAGTQPQHAGLINTLLPAVTSYAEQRSSGGNHGGAINTALNLLEGGVQQTSQTQNDPSALSATSLIKGIFQGVSNL